MVEEEPSNYRLNYQKALLTFNLFLRSINDAIKEGDGERLFDYFRFAFLYFRCYRRHKYAYTVLKSLYRIKMEPHAAFSIIWERFINTRGMKGYNISMDLHLEHLNNFLKELLKDLRSNLNKENAERVSKAVNNLKVIVENFETQTQISRGRSSRNKAKASQDVRNLCTELVKESIFAQDESHVTSYESFPKFNQHLLAKMQRDKLVEWARLKRSEFEIIYNRD